MNKKLKAVHILCCALSLAISSVTYAGYSQTIRLDISNSHVSGETAICFTTTDVFDGIHCGSIASNHYSFGPKSWTLLGGKKSEGSKDNYIPRTSLITPDSSCQPYFHAYGNTNETPKENGTLIIRGRMEQDKVTEWGEQVKLTNCSIQWQKA